MSAGTLSGLSSKVTASSTAAAAAPASTSSIRQAEKILRAAGYDPGKVDGVPTAGFRDALRTFQKAWGLPATGVLDGASLSALKKMAQRREGRSEAFVTLGMKGAGVEQVERRLARLGYDVGKVDGVFSRSTFEAVKAFKRDTPKLGNESGSLGRPGQDALAQAIEKLGGGKGDKGKDANVRAVTFNWPSRYKKGGEAADEKLFDRVAAQADVLGFAEFSWGHEKITDNEKAWSFYNPNPKGDGDGDRVGQVLAWRKDKFNLVEQGTSPLSPPTRIQSNAAGPTVHRGKHIVWAKLRHKETGELWTVAVVHFVPSKHLGGAAEKLWRRQRDALAQWMEKQGPRTLVMGDFNAKWSDGIAQPLKKVARAQHAPSHGKRGIDWVLRSKDLQAVGGGKALGNDGQSDHRPVKGVVRG